MIRFIAIWCCFCIPSFPEDGQVVPCKPAFELAFHVNEAGKSKVEELNRQSAAGQLPFDGKLAGTIQSEGIRIGGEKLGIKGTYYDRESQSIMHVGGGLELSGPRFAFAEFPPGTYLLSLDIQGTSVFSKRVSLPLPSSEAQNFVIKLQKPAVFSGRVENIPVWALENPLIGIGASLSGIDRNGNFKFTASAAVDDKFLLKFRFPNRFEKDWSQPIYRIELTCSLQGDAQSITLPDVGDWKVAIGLAKLDPELPAGFTRVLQNISIIAQSKDGSFVYRCNPDAEGRFLLIGLPDGDYSLQVDDLCNPPFVSEHIDISVVHHAAENPIIELILSPRSSR